MHDRLSYFVGYQSAKRTSNFASCNDTKNALPPERWSKKGRPCETYFVSRLSDCCSRKDCPKKRKVRVIWQSRGKLGSHGSSRVG